MNAIKRYRNRLEKYLQTERGKRFINFAYSIGAAIVILGAMFKLLHLPFGNELLFIGMITEVIIFTLSAFDTPIRDYNWDKIFPALTSDNTDEQQVQQFHSGQGLSNTPNNQTTGDSQSLGGSQSMRDPQTTGSPHTTGDSQSPITPQTTGFSNLSNQTEEYSRQMENLKDETEKMAQQLKELNEIYARMLQAMSTNREK